MAGGYTHNLWKNPLNAKYGMIKNITDDFIYADTDSIKTEGNKMNSILVNIFINMEDEDFWKEEIYNYRKIPASWEPIPRDNMIRLQINAAAVDFNMVDLELIVFDKGDWEDIIVSHEFFDHISIVADNKYHG